MIDGAGTVQLLLRVMLPLVSPGRSRSPSSSACSRGTST